MFEFTIVQGVGSSDRAYYVNGVRFNRETWRACMEHEIKCLENDIKTLEVSLQGWSIVIKATQALMDGKASFELQEHSRHFYRQVLSELRDYQRGDRYALEQMREKIEDLTDKLED